MYVAAEELIVTFPKPVDGDIEIPLPAVICVTPPFAAYEALKAYEALAILPSK